MKKQLLSAQEMPANPIGITEIDIKYDLEQQLREPLLTLNTT